MGVVYLAQDTRHDRLVAIKVLDLNYARFVGTERFTREIRIAGMLSHPSIVPLYDSGEFDGRLFYVMPYLEGESLRQLLKRETMLPVRQVVDWATEVNEALAFAHSHGVIHRDIKPENLLIQSGRLLVADFGIARAIDLASEDRITSEQLVLGTPLYMSPEQASGARLDGRTDIYSLGCVVYEMLSGEPPFGGATPQAITAKKLAGKYPSIRVIRRSVSQALDHCLARALDPNPADRFASATEFSNSLRAAAVRQRVHLLPGLLAVALIGAVSVVGVVRSRPTNSTTVRPRVAVGLFDNRTGDPRHDPLGFMAADWITEGLQRTGAVDVVPTSTALAASRFLRRQSATADPVRGLARETGASLVVSGSIYRDQDSLVLQAQLANPASGSLVGAVEPLRTSRFHTTEVLQQLRARVMGLLALSLDDRVLRGERPPLYDAYSAFSQGMDAYIRNDYAPAMVQFERAYALDSTFALPLLYASFCYTNRREYAAADSVLRILARLRSRLSTYDQHWLDYQRAELAGNESDALAAIRRAAELAPSSKATYNFAARSFEARQPFAAESALKTLSPDVGPMRGSLPYWDILTSSLHALGKHRAERKAGAEAVRRFGHRIRAYVLEARALAAEHRLTDLGNLWHEAFRRTKAKPSELGALAYEIGSELWAHSDSSAGAEWLIRSDSAFARDSTPVTPEARWGKARTAAALGRFQDAFNLAGSLVAEDSTRAEHQGFIGLMRAHLSDRHGAGEVLEKLASDPRPYTLGEPQFQAARIAAGLGMLDRATELLTFALDRGYPYDLELHRDRTLEVLRGSSIMQQLDARR